LDTKIRVSIGFLRAWASIIDVRLLATQSENGFIIATLNHPNAIDATAATSAAEPSKMVASN
jgi:hypothetical protein